MTDASRNDALPADAPPVEPPRNESTTPSILAGVRVLDLSRVLAGPWAAQLLGDFGAEVIKIERPGRGDDSRSWEPSFVSAREPQQRQSAYFCSANRGKHSVTVDFGKPEGAKLVQSLAAQSDVLIENYKSGTLARQSLGYEQLSAINPRLIYCSVTGFGQTGPYRSRAGYDTIIQAIGGLMSLTGERDGRPGAGPQRAGLPVIDLLTGVYCALAILGALRHRDQTGRGQYLDLALLDVHVSSLSYFGMNYLASGQVPVRTGNANPVTYPSGNFDCADGQIVLLVGNDQQFARFCTAIELPGLVHDLRFVTSPQRVAHADALASIITPALERHDGAHWIATLEACGVPCAPINDLKAVFADPQVRARGNVGQVVHPDLGEIPILTNPMRMSESPPRYDQPPPKLGEHTEAILAERLSLDAQALAGLRARGVI